MKPNAQESEQATGEPTPVAPGGAGHTDLFISYSRSDRDFVEKLNNALAERGFSAWVDWAGIPPTAEWMAEINAAIEAADTFVVIMTPDSMNSKVCGEEISHALTHNKRIVPLVRRDLDGGGTRHEVASLNWIFFREQDDFGDSVDTLVHALETDLERVRVHTRLLVRAREWQSGDRDRGSLLRGRDLEKAEQWMSQAGQHKDPTPTALHGEYINASRRATTQAQRRRLSFVAGALVVALALAVVAVVQRTEAIDQRNRADRRATIANSRAVAVQALSSMESRLDLGTLLATEAFRIAPTSEAVDALHIAAQRSIWIDRAMRHEDEVNSIAYNADGSVLASAGSDGTINLWDTAKGKRIEEPLEAGSGPVLSVAFSPDGSVLASGGGNGTVNLWDPATGNRLGYSLKGHSTAVLAVAFNPEGDLLASGGVDGSIILRKAETGERVGRALALETIDVVTSLAFSPDGNVLASGGEDRTRTPSVGVVERWNPETGRSVGKPLELGKEAVSGLAFSPDGHMLATGGVEASLAADGIIALWNAKTGDRIDRSFVGHTDSVLSLAFSPDGGLLASAGADRNVFLWDPKTGEPIGAPLEGHSDVVNAIAFSPEGEKLASGSSDRSVILWSALENLLRAHRGPLGSVAMSPDGKQFATASLVDLDRQGQVSGWGSLIRWTADGRQVGETVVGRKPATVAYSPDGSTLALGTLDGEVFLADSETGKQKGKPLEGHGSRTPPKDPFFNWVNAVTFSPDGRVLATGANDGTVMLWDPRTRQAMGKPLVPGGPIAGLAFSPDGRTLASGSKNGEVILWDWETGRKIGKPLKGHSGGVTSVAFTADGNLLASSSFEGPVVIRDPKKDASTEEVLKGHRVQSLAFTHDGHVLAGGTQEGTVVLWDTATWKQIGEPLVGPRDWVNSLAFSWDDGTLVAGSEDKTVYLWRSPAWDQDLATVAASLCDVAGRNLSPSEWKEFLRFQTYHKTCQDL